ncbi:hypothetical protein IW150_003011 [Coemansia sp. RSA 2607]|nr:hypothetical protein IW150_003011 [Coemansia sp. RSA 2607]
MTIHQSSSLPTIPKADSQRQKRMLENMAADTTPDGEKATNQKHSTQKSKKTKKQHRAMLKQFESVVNSTQDSGSLYENSNYSNVRILNGTDITADGDPILAKNTSENGMYNAIKCIIRFVADTVTSYHSNSSDAMPSNPREIVACEKHDFKPYDSDDSTRIDIGIYSKTLQMSDKNGKLD